MVRRHRAADAVAWSLSERRAGGVLGCKVRKDREVLKAVRTVTTSTTRAVDQAARSGEEPGIVA